MPIFLNSRDLNRQQLNTYINSDRIFKNAGAGIIYYDYSKSSNLVPDPVTMEQLAYVAAIYYVLLTVLTLVTGGATAPGYLIPVL